MTDSCEAYLAQLYAYLDGELTEHERQELVLHLDSCPPCLDEYQRDQLLKSLVRRSCACEPAPPTLRRQILTRIVTVTVQTNTAQTSTVHTSTVQTTSLQTGTVRLDP